MFALITAVLQSSRCPPLWQFYYQSWNAAQESFPLTISATFHTSGQVSVADMSVEEGRAAEEDNMYTKRTKDGKKIVMYESEPTKTPVRTAALMR